MNQAPSFQLDACKEPLGSEACWARPFSRRENGDVSQQDLVTLNLPGF